MKLKRATYVQPNPEEDEDIVLMALEEIESSVQPTATTTPYHPIGIPKRPTDKQKSEWAKFKSVGIVGEQALRIIELRDEYNKEYHGKWEDNT